MERGYIKVDGRMRTNVPGIYAIGDVTGKLALAHVASAQGTVAATDIAGKETQELNYPDMPRCTYCAPETASAGLTEAQAREKGYKVKLGKFIFKANGKAQGLGETEGFVKLVFDEEHGALLGAHMAGPHVTEMIYGIVAFLGLEVTVDEIARTVFPHPTLSETIMEAAIAAQ